MNPPPTHTHFKAFIYLVYHQRIWGIWWTISLLHPTVDEEIIPKSTHSKVEPKADRNVKKEQRQNKKMVGFWLLLLSLWRKNTFAFAPVHSLLCLCRVFGLCRCKAFVVFSLWRIEKERKQHCASKYAPWCDSGTNRSRAFLSKTDLHQCLITRKHKGKCTNRKLPAQKCLSCKVQRIMRRLSYTVLPVLELCFTTLGCIFW